MSAQLRSSGAPPPPAVRREPDHDEDDPGNQAFDRWLRDELARRYDAALAEPVPDELARLLDAPRWPRGRASE
ncbi:hypothetical protein [Roseomonas sp. AR75]|uniref:hypothetical protein n=1 Tax=Roseomonas sp. AR75 TaxID=2562311 RepID=UPI0010C06F95|nr:hypothetical protein [Roseomonas sp. AR75]